MFGYEFFEISSYDASRMFDQLFLFQNVCVPAGLVSFLRQIER